MTQEAPGNKGFDSWAVVEIMGHIKVAGRCTEEARFGVVLLRIDVPEVKKTQYQYNYDKQERETVAEFTIAAHTQYFGGSAIFRITPCSEKMAREAAEKSCSEPPVQIVIEKKLLAPPSDAGTVDGHHPVENGYTSQIFYENDDPTPIAEGDHDIERAMGEGMVSSTPPEQ